AAVAVRALRAQVRRSRRRAFFGLPPGASSARTIALASFFRIAAGMASPGHGSASTHRTSAQGGVVVVVPVVVVVLVAGVLLVVVQAPTRTSAGHVAVLPVQVSGGSQASAAGP